MISAPGTRGARPWLLLVVVLAQRLLSTVRGALCGDWSARGRLGTQGTQPPS